jgi:RND family efflux transporter MFP subunit
MFLRKILCGCLLAAIAGAAGCQKTAAPPKAGATAPANVPKVAKEDQLNTFELTPEAEERLGIVTNEAEIKPMTRMRMYGAEVTLPPGASLIVAAPLGGILKPPEGGRVPTVGEHVREGQPIFVLAPAQDRKDGTSILNLAERAALAQAQANVLQQQTDAAAAVEQAEENLKLAELEYERAEKLEKGSAGTKQRVDQAKTAQTNAQIALKAAKKRKKDWDEVKIDERGLSKPLPIEAPQDGIIRAEHVGANEAVPLGQQLFEVMNTKLLWVKVPVYEGEEREIDAGRPAQITHMEERVGAGAVEAKPFPAPPTAVPLANTIDLYYELDNRDGYFRPGQRLNASLALKDKRESLVIPWSAVVYDYNGGAWVYESLGEHKYARRRVQVKYVVDSTAVLASGPKTGAKIVGDGAAELFGTEFGFK